MPTVRPTVQPTVMPTQAPTPLPQPDPSQPLQIVGYQRVALTERALPSKYYSARRLVEDDVVFDEQDAEEGSGHVHRRLVSAADTTATCFAGMSVRFTAFTTLLSPSHFRLRTLPHLWTTRSLQGLPSSGQPVLPL
jgi:hypothetical protein